MVLPASNSSFPPPPPPRGNDSHRLAKLFDNTIIQPTLVRVVYMLAISDCLSQKKVIIINTRYPLYVAELSTPYLEIGPIHTHFTCREVKRQGDAIRIPLLKVPPRHIGGTNTVWSVLARILPVKI